MEYVDNSLDSAEILYDPGSNCYRRIIEIIVFKQGNSFKNGMVIITDNSSGISNFKKVVESIGNSDKKADYTTNGQFGYGIYSFMAACGRMEISSKMENEKAYYLSIERDQFQADRQEDVIFQDPKPCKFKNSSGTKIVLSNFDKHCWRDLDIEELQHEIEKHFELLLARKNLNIKIVDEEGHSYKCGHFDYDQYEGEVYQEYLNTLHFIKGGRSPYKVERKIENPIHIYLKVTKGKTINKSPIFVAKGRRIGEIKDIKSFKSQHKSDIWGHPNVTGFIDLNDYLDPTIARNDFKNTDASKALFSELIELEPLIMEVIKDVNKQSEDRHYRGLEDILNQALSRLAKLDSMIYRTDYVAGGNLNLLASGQGRIIEKNGGSVDLEKGHLKFKGEEGIGERDGDGKSKGNGLGDAPDEEEGNGPSNKENMNPYEDTDYKGSEKRRSGFNIRILDIEPPLDEKEKPVRSQLLGGTIQIYRKHIDFENRVEESRSGEVRITNRLITYLAGEITVHYKDKFYTRYGQPDYNKNLFIDLVDFVYQFEESLKELSGKNLSDLSK
jgi:hypothetical protein